MTRKIQLTPLEIRTLFMAAALVQDDIDEAGFTGPEKAAYKRVMRKMGDAYDIPIRRRRRERIQ